MDAKKYDEFKEKIINKFLTGKKEEHSYRVACLACSMASKTGLVNSDSAWMVGYAHDIVEDTDCTFGRIKPFLSEEEMRALAYLTHTSDESYEEYMYRIIHSDCELAKIVKLADIIDHIETKPRKAKKYAPYMKDLLTW